MLPTSFLELLMFFPSMELNASKSSRWQVRETCGDYGVSCHTLPPQRRVLLACLIFTLTNHTFVFSLVSVAQLCKLST